MVHIVWRVDVLAGHNGGEKVAVGGDGDRLRVDERYGDPVVAEDETAVAAVFVQFVQDLVQQNVMLDALLFSGSNENAGAPGEEAKFVKTNFNRP